MMANSASYFSEESGFHVECSKKPAGDPQMKTEQCLPVIKTEPQESSGCSLSINGPVYINVSKMTPLDKTFNIENSNIESIQTPSSQPHVVVGSKTVQTNMPESYPCLRALLANPVQVTNVHPLSTAQTVCELAKNEILQGKPSGKVLNMPNDEQSANLTNSIKVEPERILSHGREVRTCSTITGVYITENIRSKGFLSNEASPTEEASVKASHETGTVRVSLLHEESAATELIPGINSEIKTNQEEAVHEFDHKELPSNTVHVLHGGESEREVRSSGVNCVIVPVQQNKGEICDSPGNNEHVHMNIKSGCDGLCINNEAAGRKVHRESPRTGVCSTGVIQQTEPVKQNTQRSKPPKPAADNLPLTVVNIPVLVPVHNPNNIVYISLDTNNKLLGGQLTGQNGCVFINTKKNTHCDSRDAKSIQGMSNNREKSVYKCFVCGEIFMKYITLESHMYIHEGKDNYTCIMCGKVCLTLPSLSQHARVHSGRKPYRCKICFNGFSKKEELETHQLVHSGEKPYICNVCGKRFSCPSSLKTHSYLHTGEKPYSCNICSDSFTSHAALRDHVFKHTNEKPLLCEYCSKGFTSMSAFKRHLVSHTGERPYSCDICKRGFLHKSYLRIHKLKHFKHLKQFKRPSEKSYICDVCGKCYGSARTLKSHSCKHTRKTPYICEICQKTFSYPNSLKQHYLTHTGAKPYTCEVCNRSFAHRCNLKSHSLRHKGERAYSCKVCQKSFKTPRDVIKHSVIHVGVKPYKCEVCNRGFTRLRNMKMHALQHEKPYGCEICKKGFRQACNLERHSLIHKQKGENHETLDAGQVFDEDSHTSNAGVSHTLIT